MPIYEYKCTDCGEFFEKLQPMSAPKRGTTCPACQGTKTTRVMSAFSGGSSYEHVPVGDGGCGSHGFS